MIASAFDWHNYGKSTIGARSDIENVPDRTAPGVLKRYYQPDNAVLLVAGKFDEAEDARPCSEIFRLDPEAGARTCSRLTRSNRFRTANGS